MAEVVLLYMLEAGTGGGVVPLGGVGGGLALFVLRLGKGGGGGASPLTIEGGSLGGTTGSIWWDLGGNAGGPPFDTLGESDLRFMVAGLARWIPPWCIPKGVPFRVPLDVLPACKLRIAISGVP